jgi:inorganic triphosphatase YgiF
VSATTAAPPPVEVEAKLTAAGDHDLEAIAALGAIGPFELRRRGVDRLHSVYFDTENLVLARHGIALRARQRRRRWEITLKWLGEVSGVIHARPELTAPLAGPPGAGRLKLPAGFDDRIRAYVAGRPLLPVLVTDIRRQRVDVHRPEVAPGSPSLAELALDAVELRAPGEVEALSSYHEVEIELRDGRREDIDVLARLLQQQYQLTPSVETKFSHGINLLHGPLLAAFEPPVADGSVRQAAQRLMDRHLRRLRLHDWGTRVGEDPEAVHDMRVACRRLRAVLRFLAPAFPERRRDHLRNEVRWLSRILSPVRDCDVQLETLHRYEAALPADRRRALRPYRDHILRERDGHRRAMLGALDSKRYFSLLLGLEQFVDDRRRPRTETPLRPAAEVGHEGLERAFKRLRRQGKSVVATPKPEDLHRVRIRGKRLRYLLEFFRPSTGKPGRRFLRYLIRLQDLLGTHNDAIVASAFLEGWVNGPGADSKPATLLTLGGLLQEERRRGRKARTRFHRAWARFDAKSARADWKAVLRILRQEAEVIEERRAARRTDNAKEK